MNFFLYMIKFFIIPKMFVFNFFYPSNFFYHFINFLSFFFLPIIFFIQAIKWYVKYFLSLYWYLHPSLATIKLHVSHPLFFNVIENYYIVSRTQHWVGHRLGPDAPAHFPALRRWFLRQDLGLTRPDKWQYVVGWAICRRVGRGGNAGGQGQ